MASPTPAVASKQRDMQTGTYRGTSNQRDCRGTSNQRDKQRNKQTGTSNQRDKQSEGQANRDKQSEGQANRGTSNQRDKQSEGQANRDKQSEGQAIRGTSNQRDKQSEGQANRDKQTEGQANKGLCLSPPMWCWTLLSLSCVQLEVLIFCLFLPLYLFTSFCVHTAETLKRRKATSLISFTALAHWIPQSQHPRMQTEGQAVVGEMYSVVKLSV